MSIISSTTGHNRQQEIWIAKVLYIALATAVIIALITAYIASRSSRHLDPSYRTPVHFEQVKRTESHGR